MFRSPLIAGVPVACSDGRYRARYPDGVWSPPLTPLAGAAAANAGASGALTTGAGGGAALIFSHNFENNSLDPAGGVSVPWKRIGPPTVSTAQANGGTRSARLVYDDELGYELVTPVPSLTVQWDLRVPDNYRTNRNFPGDQGPNNKVARICSSVGYGSSEKVGFSTFEQPPGHVYPVCELIPEWGAPGGNGSAIGAKGTGSLNYITAANEGNWITCKMFYSPPKAAGAGNRGTLKFWKNGSLIINETGNVDNYHAADTHDVKYFYLLGAANSGFSAVTPWFIDNVSVWSGEA